MEIRNYTPEHIEEIMELFYSTIYSIDSIIDSYEQKEVWAQTPSLLTLQDYNRWRLRLARNKTYLAFINDKVVGFIVLKFDGHIDFIITHPEHGDKGVAFLLYSNVEMFAKARDMAGLSVEASIIAKPFFEQRGFMVINKNKFKKSGQVLINYSMEKLLIYNSV